MNKFHLFHVIVYYFSYQGVISSWSASKIVILDPTCLVDQIERHINGLVARYIIGNQFVITMNLEQLELAHQQLMCVKICTAYLGTHVGILVNIWVKTFCFDKIESTYRTWLWGDVREFSVNQTVKPHDVVKVKFILSLYTKKHWYIVGIFKETRIYQPYTDISRKSNVPTI